MTTKQGTGRPPKGQPPGRATVYAALVAFKAQNDGLSPTVLDLAGLTGLSESSIKYHLLRLANEGQIVRVRQGYMIPGARWLPPVDEQPEPDQPEQPAAAPPDDPPQDAPPAKMEIAPFEDMGGDLRRELAHYRRASAANLVEADTARAAVAKLEGQLAAARSENKQLKAQIAERDETIAALRAELARLAAPRPVPIRYLPAPAPLGMAG